MGIGDWGLGVWGLGFGPNPQTPNPKSQIPNPQSPCIYKFFNKKEINQIILKLLNKNIK